MVMLLYISICTLLIPCTHVHSETGAHIKDHKPTHQIITGSPSDLTVHLEMYLPSRAWHYDDDLEIVKINKLHQTIPNNPTRLSSFIPVLL